MSWYNEKRDGSTKFYLEWFCGEELVPDEEPGYYKPKNILVFRHNIKKELDEAIKELVE